MEAYALKSDCKEEIEKAFLASVLVGLHSKEHQVEALTALNEIWAESFSHPYHVNIWACAQEAIKECEHPDRLMLSSRFDKVKRRLIVQILDAVYENRVAVFNLKWYRDAHLENYRRRLYLELGSLVQDEEKNVEKIRAVEEKIEQIRKLLNRQTNEFNLKRLGDIFDSRMVLLQDAEGHYNEQYEFPVVNTGFYNLNRVVSGWGTASLNLIGARSTTGKSLFAHQAILNQAKHGAKVVLYDYEVGAEEIYLRMLCSIARVDSKRVKDKVLEPDEQIRLLSAREELDKIKDNIQILESTAGIDTLCSEIIEKSKNADVIYIDHIGIPSANGRTEYEKASDKAQKLLNLKMKIKKPIIALVQLSRANVKENRFPSMEDLRDSGKYEENADAVVLLHAPKREDEEAIEPFYIKVAKNRNGATGTIVLKLERKYTRLYDKKWET